METSKTENKVETINKECGIYEPTADSVIGDLDEALRSLAKLREDLKSQLPDKIGDLDGVLNFLTKNVQTEKRQNDILSVFNGLENAILTRDCKHSLISPRRIRNKKK